MPPGGSDVDRGLVVKGRMQASSVVFEDPVLDVAAGDGAVGPGADADLRFDGREERLRCGAVETGSAAAVPCRNSGRLSAF